MYAPALSLPAALAPVAIAESAAAPTPTPAPVLARTALRVRGDQLNVLAEHRASVTGRLLADGRPGPAGEQVALQALGTRGWKTIASTSTHTGGRFRVSFSPRRLGSELVRVRFAGGEGLAGSHRRLGRLNVFRVVEASWYGGGGSLACGGELTSTTMGVANKTLPCGTLVTLRYDGHDVRVPVIDRGPYVEGREFDLTEATKDALGFVGVGEVWSTS
jgi:rare lipoprotein A